MVMGHSILIPAGTVPCLPVDSVIETHHLFGLTHLDLGKQEDRLPDDIIADALAGARRLFT